MQLLFLGRFAVTITMINIINLVIFIGLAISGISMATGFVLVPIYPTVSFFGTMLTIGIFTGWFFGAIAVLSFFMGSFVFLFFSYDKFWDNFYPLNLGMTLLGLWLVSYNPVRYPALWIFATSVSAIICAFVLYKLGLTKQKLLRRLLLLILIGLIFLAENWGALIGGVVFISLSCFSGVSRTILSCFEKPKSLWD